MPAKYRLTQVIARREGFGISDKIPTTHHNPIDLRHSPHSEHSPEAPNAIGQIDSDADGWADGDRQLELWAERGYTVESMVFDVLAPPTENNSAEYVQFLCDQMGCKPETPIAELLKIPAETV